MILQFCNKLIVEVAINIDSSSNTVHLKQVIP